MKPLWYSRIELARAHGLDDHFTKLTFVVVNIVCTVVAVVLFPIGVITTFLGGLLIGLTFGLLLIPINLIWLSIFGALAGTSWLWLHAWYLRPLLVLPGLLLAVVGSVFVVLTPMPEETLRGDKALKGFLASEWPLTWLIWQGPPEPRNPYTHSDTRTDESERASGEA